MKLTSPKEETTLKPKSPQASLFLVSVGVATIGTGAVIIREVWSEPSDEPASTPQLPIEKEPSTPAPITSPYDTTPEPEFPASPPDTSEPPPELVRVYEKYGGILEQLPDGTWHVLI